MPELRSCTVKYCDLEGVTHTVEVSASSLYEAAVLGRKAFEQTGWADHPVGEVEVIVTAPAVKHRVPVGRLKGWLRSGARSPRDMALKSRLKELLGWND